MHCCHKHCAGCSAAVTSAGDGSGSCSRHDLLVDNSGCGAALCVDGCSWQVASMSGRGAKHCLFGLVWNPGPLLCMTQCAPGAEAV